MYATLSAVEMLILAQPRPIRSVNCSSVIPVPPCRAIGMSTRATMSETRCASSVGVRE